MSAPPRKDPNGLAELTLTTGDASLRTATRLSLLALLALAITCLAWIASWYHYIQNASLAVDLCPQVPELVPVKNRKLWDILTETFDSDAFRSRAVDWLSGAIQIPTESYDEMGPVGVDPRWETFAVLHAYLERSFPLVYSALELTTVNTYGLICVWKGSDVTLKPLLLTAHQDVVPVEPATHDRWTHPPFSGYFDGNHIWGRGSVDDKSRLIGILAAMETMLANNYRPTRTVVFASGFDEECNGTLGAGTIAPRLQEMFGENGFAMLVDEGAGYGEQYGRVIATPGIAEKGFVNVKIEVNTPGGHSSLPPSHTSIGLLAELLVAVERHPFDVHLARGSPMYKNFQCLARHAPDLPRSLRRDIIQAERSDKALQSAEKELFKSGTVRNLVGTTQAIDLVQGGVKVNALPERAYAVVNHRISVESSVSATRERDAELLRSVARQYSLSYRAFGIDMDNGTARGSVTLSTTKHDTGGLEPAPITPTEGPYWLLSGSIKAAYNSHRRISGDHIVVSPGIMSANTDTKSYWNLTRHIFRYGHIDGAVGGVLLPGVHTVNEALSASSLVEMIRFIAVLVLNVDEGLFA